ncbi:hypothetical protein PAAG_01416 [Paracoccidioides lutzii Pb01]|uniref:Uncharacterized protein n=1 Tax=Paracoccidioides lutzii (strain ATCC MYA-826 / Pb01) TaxID=502779 RepID=C1GSC1_PARBA|nr:hypothetical protein PAAG_01416 [Paracoccidioides lutzii Pb01]EEH38954.2 hypothetical protein PAAG_01416 [Paracoccidioides lutzii Pb01]
MARRWLRVNEKSFRLLPQASNADENSFQPQQLQWEPLRDPNFASTTHSKVLPIILEKENCINFVANAMLYATFYDVKTTVASLFYEIYEIYGFQIGLCYLPIGIRAFIASISNSFILDCSYRRIVRKQGIPACRDKQGDFRHFSSNTQGAGDSIHGHVIFFTKNDKDAMTFKIDSV